VPEIVGLYRPSARNGLVKDLYPRLGFEPVLLEEDGCASFGLAPSSACFEAPPMRIALTAQPAPRPSAVAPA
jgi:predicted enzyme involved in methoxymalonyl-ACP biosynthesis